MADGSPLPAAGSYAAYCVRASSSCTCLLQHGCFLRLCIDGGAVWLVEASYAFPQRPATEWWARSQLQLYAL